MTCVAESGNLVAVDQWIGLVKINSHKDLVTEPDSSRKSEPDSNKI